LMSRKEVADLGFHLVVLHGLGRLVHVHHLQSADLSRHEDQRVLRPSSGNDCNRASSATQPSRRERLFLPRPRPWRAGSAPRRRLRRRCGHRASERPIADRPAVEPEPGTGFSRPRRRVMPNAAIGCAKTDRPNVTGSCKERAIH
jgi:hypothetical protein